MYIYGWRLEGNMNIWKQFNIGEFFYVGGGGWPLYCSSRNLIFSFLPKTVSTRGQTEDDKTEPLSTSLSWKVENPASSVESNLKGHLSLASSYYKGNTEVQRKQQAGPIRGGESSPSPHFSICLFLPNYSASANKAMFKPGKGKFRGIGDEGQVFIKKGFFVGFCSL